MAIDSNRWPCCFTWAAYVGLRLTGELVDDHSTVGYDVLSHGVGSHDAVKITVALSLVKLS